MPDGRRRMAIAGLAVAAALLFWAVRSTQAPPEGPVAVPWDQVRCTRCGMLVSERGFAAQLHTGDGEILHFDDPGCLLLHEHAHAPEATRVYFQEMRGDAWLTRAEAGFIPAETTPMGYGLGAVERTTADALSPEAALALALARERERRDP